MKLFGQFRTELKTLQDGIKEEIPYKMVDLSDTDRQALFEIVDNYFSAIASNADDLEENVLSTLGSRRKD
jgi:hypothetical protein